MFLGGTSDFTPTIQSMHNKDLNKGGHPSHLESFVSGVSFDVDKIVLQQQHTTHLTTYEDVNSRSGNIADRSYNTERPRYSSSSSLTVNSNNIAIILKSQQLTGH